ncbi:hypothetical protein SAMN05192541_12090 [Bradyrhizobium arachidis]|nr:hypothetical protein SAMN05192541_12090 [Bradyrhizobium arachidis]
MLRLGEGNVPQMERFPNDIGLDRRLDLLRGLRSWLSRACLAFAQAQAYAPALRPLWFAGIPDGRAARVLRLHDSKAANVMTHLSRAAFAMTKVTMST